MGPTDSRARGRNRLAVDTCSSGREAGTATMHCQQAACTESILMERLSTLVHPFVVAAAAAGAANATARRVAAAAAACGNAHCHCDHLRHGIARFIASSCSAIGRRPGRHVDSGAPAVDRARPAVPRRRHRHCGTVRRGRGAVRSVLAARSTSNNAPTVRLLHVHCACRIAPPSVRLLADMRTRPRCDSCAGALLRNDNGAAPTRWWRRRRRRGGWWYRPWR